jgi:hypothetical protein
VTEKQKKALLIGAACFVIYVFAAAQPIPMETILTARWFFSVESSHPAAKPDPQTQTKLLPFSLGGRLGHFGYVDKDGNFTINQTMKEQRSVSLSPSAWAEHDSAPEEIQVRNPLNQMILAITGKEGYPFFRDEKIFLLGKHQTSLTRLDDSGEIIWTYDFAAPLTVVDAAAGLVLAGLLDGTVEVLNEKGRRIFAFEPGGSRRSVIYGAAMSKDGGRLAVVSGIDLQRFLLLERYGDEEVSGGVEYKVIYHEFLEEGFRRAVYVQFIDHDGRVAFERQGGLGLYEIRSRSSLKLPLTGEIREIDSAGGDRLLFLITAQGQGRNRLVAVRLPGTIIIEAPFKSEHVFLGRQDSRIYVGGNLTLASFELEKK